MATTAVIAQNADSIHVHAAKMGWSTADGDGGAAGPIKTANTTKDGTAGALNLIFTAGANGSMLNNLIFKAAGANVATVARVFVNNGSTLATAANNVMRKEIPLPVTVLDEAVGNTDVEVLMSRFLPAGYRVYVTLGTTVAAGWWAIAEGGDF
jgi:hypothetical protein